MSVRNYIQLNKSIFRILLIGSGVLLVSLAAFLLVTRVFKLQDPNKNQAYMKYVDNLPQLKKKTEKNPSDANLMESYAYALYVTGDTTQSISTYEKVKNTGTLDAEGLNTLGTVYRRAKEYPKAIEAFNASIQKDSNQINAYVNLAQLYIQNMNDYKQGIAVFSEVLKHHPSDTNLMYMLGKIYEKNGDVTSALDLYTQILSIKPNDQSAQTAKLALSQK